MKGEMLTIKVLFAGRVFDAVVSLVERQYDLCFRVYFKSLQARAYVPTGCLQFSFINGVETGLGSNAGTDAFIDRTIEALSRHIEAFQSITPNP
jgi:hypothetical protein